MIIGTTLPQRLILESTLRISPSRIFFFCHLRYENLSTISERLYHPGHGAIFKLYETLIFSSLSALEILSQFSHYYYPPSLFYVFTSSPLATSGYTGAI